MEEVKDIYIRKDLVAHKELSELDFELHDKFGFDYEEGEITIIDSIKSDEVRAKVKYGYVDTTPLSIATLEKLLTKFKSKGATHIQMAHHGDHHGYMFSGFNIEVADGDLIKSYQEEIEKKKQLYKERKKLSQQMAIIDNDISELKI